ncbi:MAG: hypothetical protein ACREHD_07845, partial [Pirellulales bacterium]
MTIGTGDLASIQGSVDVEFAQLTVNDAASTVANVITVNGTSVTGWKQSNSSPSLTFGGLYGTLAVVGGAADRFDVENTPSSVDNTVLTNSATGAPQGVYVMGDTTPLYVTGDFVLTVGQRLNGDGSVSAVGVADALAAEVLFDYTGPGTTQFYLDESHDTALTGSTDTLLSPPAAAPAGYNVPPVVFQNGLPIFTGAFTYGFGPSSPLYGTNNGPGYTASFALTGTGSSIGGPFYSGGIYYYEDDEAYQRLDYYFPSLADNFQPLGYTNDWFQGFFQPNDYGGDLLGDRKVSYGANVEFFAYLAPQAACYLANTTPAAIHILDTNPANAQGQAATVYDQFSAGPVYVQGNGATAVQIANEYNASDLQRQLFGTRYYGDDLLVAHNILADVYVADASLAVGTPFDVSVSSPANIAFNVDLTGSTLTGVAKGTIHFTGLSQLDISLSLESQTGGGTVVVENTPSAATTLSVYGASDWPASILGTTGALTLNNFGQVSIGDQGSLQDIQGPINAISSPDLNGALLSSLVVDDSADTAARQADLTGPFTPPTGFGYYVLAGLTIAPMQFTL